MGWEEFIYIILFWKKKKSIQAVHYQGELSEGLMDTQRRKRNKKDRGLNSSHDERLDVIIVKVDRNFSITSSQS